MRRKSSRATAPSVYAARASLVSHVATPTMSFPHPGYARMARRWVGLVRPSQSSPADYAGATWSGSARSVLIDTGA
jgi:hypothetical protein